MYLPLAKLAGMLPEAQAARFAATVADASAALAGRAVWNISATAAGGGVAEMLYTLPGYLRAAGVNARWLVLDGDEEFFTVTKLLHNAVHGLGDPSGLGPGAHMIDQRALDRNLPALLDMIRRLGQAAQRRARENFLDDRHIGQSVELLRTMLDGALEGRIADDPAD